MALIWLTYLHKSRLCAVPYTGLDLLEPLAGGDVIVGWTRGSDGA